MGNATVSSAMTQAMTFYRRSSRTQIELHFLMTGLRGAGKTSLLHHMQLGSIGNSAAGTPANIETACHRGPTAVVSCSAWDVDPKTQMPERVMRALYKKAQALIFVVDCGDGDKVTQANECLKTLLQDEDLQTLPILVFANKQDAKDITPMPRLAKALELQRFKQPWFIQGSNGKSGDGVFAGLDWIASNLQRQHDNTSVVDLDTVGPQVSAKESTIGDLSKAARGNQYRSGAMVHKASSAPGNQASNGATSMAARVSAWYSTRPATRGSMNSNDLLNPGSSKVRLSLDTNDILERTSAAKAAKAGAEMGRRESARTPPRSPSSVQVGRRESGRNPAPAEQLSRRESGWNPASADQMGRRESGRNPAASSEQASGRRESVRNPTPAASSEQAAGRREAGRNPAPSELGGQEPGQKYSSEQGSDNLSSRQGGSVTRRGSGRNQGQNQYATSAASPEQVARRDSGGPRTADSGVSRLISISSVRSQATSVIMSLVTPGGSRAKERSETP